MANETVSSIGRNDGQNRSAGRVGKKRNFSPEEAVTWQKRSHRRKMVIVRIVQYAVLTALACFFLFPFAVLVLKSFMTADEAWGVPIVIFPSSLCLEGFKSAFDAGFFLQLWNTVVITVANCIAIPLSSSLCAYGFAKCKFKGKGFWFAITLSTIMLPSIVVQIPVYVMFVGFGWVDTFYPLIIPSLLGGGAVNIFLIRQFIRSLPHDLNEAAKIDGANELVIFARIIIPLCIPVLLLVVINTFIGNWNDFMGPLLYLRNPQKYTLGIAIYNNVIVENNYGNKSPNVQMAAGLLMTLPPAILFFIFQRQLIDGIALSGVKG